MFKNYKFYVYGRFSKMTEKVFLENNQTYEKAIKIFQNCLENKENYFSLELGIKEDKKETITLVYFSENQQIVIFDNFRGTYLEGRNEIVFNLVRELKKVFKND